MRLLCCHTGRNTAEERHLHPETEMAIAEHARGCQVEYVDCLGKDTRYHQALERFWRDGAAFVNVEQDIVIDKRVIPSFEACPWPWCVYVYEIAVGYVPGVLGCVRFTSQLLAAEPDAMTVAGKPDSSGAPLNAWFRVDVRLDRILRDRGYLPHVHGRVGHLNATSRLQDPDGAYLESLEKIVLTTPPGVFAL